MAPRLFRLWPNARVQEIVRNNAKPEGKAGRGYFSAARRAAKTWGSACTLASSKVLTGACS